MASSSTNSDLPDHMRQNIFALFGTYEALHTYGIQLRNPILPRLGPQRVEQHKWTQVRKILRQMPSLRDLKAATYANAFTPGEEDLHEGGDPTENTALLGEPVNRLWPPNIIDEWRDFDFSIDFFPSGRTWQSVYYLKRKRRSGSDCGEEAFSTPRTATN